MGQRTPRVHDAVSSRARAVESYYPFYPPPVYPLEQDVRGGYGGFMTVPGSYVDERTDKGVVNAQWNRWGDRTQYTWGGVLRRVFRMIGTGQVESSQANTISNMPLVAQFNDHLYRAAKGYPRNLGISEKVPTLPQEALGNNPMGQMRPRPQFTRNIFTRRTASNIKTIPAKPQAR